MWRQMRVDRAYRERIVRAVMRVQLLAAVPVLIMFALFVALGTALSIAGGSWFLPVFGVTLLALIPLNLWRSAVRASRVVPDGSFVGYAVTNDGALHASTAAGTTVINPGFIAAASGTADCWVLRAFNGFHVIAPRELLPDADVALLVRHLQKRPEFKPALRPPL